MLRLTRTAIGLLTAQYRSVLRKCWAINVGVFGLMGKAAASMAKGAADTIGGTLSAFGVNVMDIWSMMRLLDNELFTNKGKSAPTVAGTLTAFGVNVMDGFSVMQAFKRGLINSVLNGLGMGKSAPTVGGTLSAFGVNVMDNLLLNLQDKNLVKLKALPNALVAKGAELRSEILAFARMTGDDSFGLTKALPVAVVAATIAATMPTTAMAEDAEDATFTPTLDAIKGDAEKGTTHYANLASGEHGQYELATTKGSHTHSIYIDGTRYYYTPAETGDDAATKNAELVNLLNTGTVALKSVGADGNWVIKAGSKYYGYDATKLPSSVYSVSAGASNNYTFTTTDGTDKAYYKIALDTQKLGSSAFTWGTTSQSGGTATGSVSFKLPKKGSAVDNTLYYKYTAPSGYSSQSDIHDLSSSVTRKYFYDQHYSTRESGDSVDTSSGFSDAAYGGAIHNTSNGKYSITADFINNSVQIRFDDYGNGDGNLAYSGSIDLYARGGAIANSGILNNIVGDFINNYLKQTDPCLDGGNTGISIYNYTYGGAIYNSGTIGNIEGDFIGNSTHDDGADFKNIASFSGYGGAIFNDTGTIGSITGDFIGNSAMSQGGVIYNASGTIGNLTGDFIGNSVNGSGGAIYSSSGTIGNLTGDFISNSAYSGGAIYSSGGTIGNLTGDFIGNSASGSGGAINGGSFTNLSGDFIGNSASDGGAIYDGRFTNLSGDFIGNSASNGRGGAIYGGTIGNLTGDFIGNRASSQGGAIYSSKFTNLSGDFIGNSANEGGAIYASGKSYSALTGNFTDNFATNGAAIYLNYDSNLKINADDQDVIFHNNYLVKNLSGKVFQRYNDIYIYDTSSSNYTQELVLNAAEGQKISFGGTIEATNNSSVDTKIIKINSDDNIKGGTYSFNNELSNVTLDVYNSGTLTLGKEEQEKGYDTYGSLKNSYVIFRDANSTLNTINDHIDAVDITKLTMNDDINLTIDVDLYSAQGDSFNVGTFVGGSSNIVLSAINLVVNSEYDEVLVNITKDSDIKNRIVLADNLLDNMSGIANKYTSITYIPKTGNLLFGSRLSEVVDETVKPTLDVINAKTRAYLANVNHGKYTLTTTATNNDGERSLVINGTTYYFTPNERTAAQNKALVELVNTGMANLVTGSATDYVFKADSNYYKFDYEKLPHSVYRIEDATARKYTFSKVDNSGERNYYKISLRSQELSNSDKIEWVKGGYDAAPVTWDSTKRSATGKVAIDLPVYGDVTGKEKLVYTYTYKTPSGYSSDSTTNLTAALSNKYHYDRSSPLVGTGSATLTNVDFIKNYRSSSSSSTDIDVQGGAVKWSASKDITGNFIGNYIDGRLYGNSEAANDLDGYFRGGALYTGSSSNINIVGDFVDNYILLSESGSSKDANLYGKAYGGAIFAEGNINSIVGNFLGNSLRGSDSSDSDTGTSFGLYGGAIYNDADINIIKGNFIGNYITKGGEIVGEGGAIYNDSGHTIGSITGDFISNNAYQGGAINNLGRINSITGDFIGNSARNDGGAIYNSSATIGSITGDFIGNSASSGGAIYNSGGSSTIGLLAKNRDVNFYNNTASSGFVDIFNNYGTVNMNAASDYAIKFGGKILGNSGKININNSLDASERGGIVSFGNDVKSQDIYVFNGGTVHLGETVQEDGSKTYGAISTGSTLNYDNNGGKLSTKTDHIEDININALNLMEDINLELDVDLEKEVADRFHVTTLNGTGSFIIEAINLMSSSDGDEVYVNITQDANIMNRISMSDAIMANITGATNPYQTITYDRETGDIVFAGYQEIENPDPGEGGEGGEGGGSQTGVITAKQLIGSWRGGNYIKTSASTAHMADGIDYLTVGQALTNLDVQLKDTNAVIGKNFTDEGFKFTPYVYRKGETEGTVSDAEKPQLDADDLNILKGYDVATNGVTGALARLDYELSNNYYRKNKKSEILSRFEGWKTGNKITDSLSKCHVANDNFVSVENKVA